MGSIDWQIFTDAFKAFRRWRRKANLTAEQAFQAQFCSSYLSSLEMNLSEPNESLRRDTLFQLHKLERMLAFPTI